jgi:hypothetical protein
MVERKLRPAPSTLHLLPSRRSSKSGSASTTKLFVLDTNVLMHDPTSLFRFEEHDVYLPILTLEELDSNKKGMTEVARNARQVSRFLDELVTAQGDSPADDPGRRRGGSDSGRWWLVFYDLPQGDVAARYRGDEECNLGWVHLESGSEQ